MVVPLQPNRITYLEWKSLLDGNFSPSNDLFKKISLILAHWNVVLSSFSFPACSVPCIGEHELGNGMPHDARYQMWAFAYLTARSDSCFYIH